MFLAIAGGVIALVALQTGSAGAHGNDSPAACEATGVLDIEAGSGGNTGDQVSYTAGSGKVVTSVCIKSGSNTFGDLQHSALITSNGTYGNNDCYTVSGLGTATVTVTRKNDNSCKDISHIDVVLGSGTPTSTQTGTPTGTPTGSDTGTPTSTPTSTPTQTSTPTPTGTTTGTPTQTGTPTATATQGQSQGMIQVHKYVWINGHWQNQGVGQATFNFDVHAGSAGGSIIGTGNQLQPITVDSNGTVFVTEQSLSGYTFAGFTVPDPGNSKCEFGDEFNGPFTAAAQVDLSQYQGIAHVCAYNMLASTPTPTGTVTGTPTQTGTPTPTGTVTGTPTGTVTGTPTGTQTGTPTATASSSVTSTSTPTGTTTTTPTGTTPSGTTTSTPRATTPSGTTTPTGTTPSGTTTTATRTPTQGVAQVTQTPPRQQGQTPVAPVTGTGMASDDGTTISPWLVAGMIALLSGALLTAIRARK